MQLCNKKMSYEQFVAKYLSDCKKNVVTSDELKHEYGMYLWHYGEVKYATM